jgi:ABC-type transport system involved in multi-copper enzyme maturation permease subunit
LLSTTTAIASELESRSWVYLTVRPHGGTAVLLGKYLAAVTMVIPVALLGLTIAVPLSGVEHGFQVWWSFARLVLLSCPAYSAIYLLLGVINPRRAMVLAVAYSLLFELIVSLVPAVINKLTVHYRLRALMIDWCDMDLPEGTNSNILALMGNSSPIEHVSVLLFLTPLLLTASVLMLRSREFTSAAESDV